MKHRFMAVLLPVLLCALLGACHREDFQSTILVSLAETDDYAVVENGFQISPGQNVCFSLQMAPGTELSGTDFDGPYYIWKENGLTKLELRDVRFPTCVTAEVTRFYRQITYSPNGGTGEGCTVTYDTSIHTRPNTAIGTDIFSRPGFTLTCWNTASDGSGIRIGLGSRVTVPEAGITLYAQWAPWASPSDFSYKTDKNSVTLLRYTGKDNTVVIPEQIDGLPVTVIASGAFAGSTVQSVILPKSLVCVEDGAFDGCTLESLLLFDNIDSISDAAFANCSKLQTLYINAIEAPYGFAFRRESVYADKIDMMIDAQGQKKIVFYGGCSMWYNLNGQAVQNALPDYVVINAAINGTVNSYVQMQIMDHYLEAGDLFFHTPELPSKQQLLIDTNMGRNDDKLWCGLEYNYDLFALVDIRGIVGVFDTFHTYLSKKTEAAGYRQQYMDTDGNLYMDATGSIPFRRTVARDPLAESNLVCLDLDQLRQTDQTPLAEIYRTYADKGVTVYISYASMDYTALTEEEQANVGEAHRIFREVIRKMGGPALISTIWDYLYDETEFYDSAFHLLTPAVERNTAAWLRDLREQMLRDGLLSGQ